MSEQQELRYVDQCFVCDEPVPAGEGGFRLNPSRPTNDHPEGLPWRVHEECKERPAY